MADTVAVMNHGRIEQMGDPVSLYESPRTTFVANFLGQSNLLTATRVGGEGGDVVADVQGRRVRVPATRVVGSESSLLVGVRPEKVRLHADGAGVPAGHNALDGGIVEDASFMGVSTQYLVRMPWGQALTVFAQNLGVGDLYPVGSRVCLTWEPAHTFGLVGDAHAGVEDETAAVPAGAQG